MCVYTYTHTYIYIYITVYRHISVIICVYVCKYIFSCTQLTIFMGNILLLSSGWNRLGPTSCSSGPVLLGFGENQYNWKVGVFKWFLFFFSYLFSVLGFFGMDNICYTAAGFIRPWHIGRLGAHSGAEIAQHGFEATRRAGRVE